MNKLTLHPAIEHLSRADIEILTEKYLSGAKVSELVSQFNVKCAPSNLVRTLPPRSLEQSCPVCGSVMVQDLPSRTYPNPSPKIHCSSCSHEEGNRCRCKHCQELRAQAAAEENARREAIIAQAVKAQRERYICASYSPEGLSLSLTVAFLAFIRCCPVTKNGLYGQLNANPVPFAPTAAYRVTLLASLMQAGLISLSERSEAGSIAYKDSQLIFVAGKVSWTGDIDKNLKLAEEIELRALTGNWPSHWFAEVEENWLNLALAECREFYDYCLDMRGLYVQGDQAITSMLRNILRDFSVGQCYRIIWHGAKNASDFLARKRISRAHAGNYMVGACQRYADQARTQGYELFPFKRNFDLPRSMISYVLFDVLLKIGEHGFTDPIRLSTLEDGSDNAW